MPLLVRHSAAEVLLGVDRPLQGVLARIGEVAQAQPCVLWLVGGVVRDLLLGVAITHDLDLAVEGDAVSLAQTVAAALGGRVTARHAAFGTATVLLEMLDADGQTVPLTLDLASTRTEHYPHPAALPVVQMAPLEQDLARRDFTVNAIAVSLPPVPGAVDAAVLLDPFGGQHDLAAGVLRVLHTASLRDDPTRIVRGLRLAARLGLQFAPETAALLHTALADGLLEATTPDRIRTELCLALAEPHPAAVLKLADELGVTPHIFAPLQWRAALADRIERARAPEPRTKNQAPTPNPQPLLLAGLLTYDLTMAEREDLIRRYRLPNDAARLLREVGMLQERLGELQRPDLRNSDIETLLRPYTILALDVVRYAEPARLGALITHYVTELRSTLPLLDGHALQQLGVAPGPRLGMLLAALRAARLDGIVCTRADEESWVRRQLNSEQGGEAA